MPTRTAAAPFNRRPAPPRKKALPHPRGFFVPFPPAYPSRFGGCRGARSGSGFDRGHNCPSADRTDSAADNTATFLMSNTMPQAPSNNQQTWANLENNARALADAGNELYLVCGSYGRGGTGSSGYATTVAGAKVTVPARCWKVLVLLPVGTNDVARVSPTTRVIAIDTPNDNSLSSNWGTYRTSVDAIGAATGLDLLSALSAGLQSTLEARTDAGPTN